MMMHSCLAFALLVTALLPVSLASLPVLPSVSLRHPSMQDEHACLYICGMCFNDDFKWLTYCLENACSPGNCNVVDLVLMGRKCQRMDLLDMYVYPRKESEFETQKTSH